MQDLLFALDPVEEPKVDTRSGQSGIGAKLARIATHATVAASSAIAEWAGAERMEPWMGRFALGTHFLTEYGSVAILRRVVANGESGDVTLLLDSGNHEADEYAGYVIFFRARLLGDGSLVSALGDRLLPEALAPKAGRADGPVNPGAILSHGYGWARVLGISGLWAVVSQYPPKDDGEPGICHLGAALGGGAAPWRSPSSPKAAVSVLPANWPDIERFQGLPNGVVEWLDRSMAERVSNEVAALIVSASTSIDSLFALHAIRGRYAQLSDRFPMTRGALQPMAQLFQLDLDDGVWKAHFALNLDYGWRLDARGEAVHVPTGREVDVWLDTCRNDTEAFLGWFDPARRVDQLRTALEREVKRTADAVQQPSRPQTAKAEARSLSSMQALAEGLRGAKLTNEEADAVEAILGTTGPVPKAVLVQLGARAELLSVAAHRIEEESRPGIRALIAKDPWSSEDLDSAQTILNGSFVPEFHRLKALAEAHEAAVLVEEVAPGWWVAVGPKKECHGAVSETGFHSKVVDTPAEAAESYVSGASERRSKAFQRMMSEFPAGVQGWLNEQGDRLDWNRLSALSGPTAYALACSAASGTFQKAIALLSGPEAATEPQDGIQTVAAALGGIRDVTFFGDPQEVKLAAGFLLDELSARFGVEAVGTPVHADGKSLFDDESEEEDGHGHEDGKIGDSDEDGDEAES